MGSKNSNKEQGMASPQALSCVPRECLALSHQCLFYVLSPQERGDMFLLTFRKNFLAIRDVELWLPLEAVNTLSLIQMFMESGPGSVLGAVGHQRGMRQDFCPQGLTAET